MLKKTALSLFVLCGLSLQSCLILVDQLGGPPITPFSQITDWADYEGAMEQIETAIRENPNAWENYFDRGRTHYDWAHHEKGFRLQAFNKALKDFEKALSLNPPAKNRQAIIQYQGHIYERVGKCQLAYQYYKAACQADTGICTDASTDGLTEDFAIFPKCIAQPEENLKPQPLAPPIMNFKTHMNGYNMKFIQLPTGRFQMGNAQSDTLFDAVTSEEIATSFYLAETELTRGQWKAIMEDEDIFSEEDFPHVLSIAQAEQLIAKLNQNSQGETYRLPTEAEWEYAARAGTNGDYPWGNNSEKLVLYGNYADQKFANAYTTTSAYPDQEERYKALTQPLTQADKNDGFQKLAPVASYLPNPWGFYDMQGNLSELTSSYLPSTVEYGEAILKWAPNPVGDGVVIRGGNFMLDAIYHRVHTRDSEYALADEQVPYLGVRLVLELQS